MSSRLLNERTDMSVFRNNSRRWLLAGGLAAALLTLGACAQSGTAGPGGWSGHQGHHGHRGMGAMTPEQMNARIERGVDRALSRIDGTPEQKQKITAIAQRAAADLRPMRERHQAARKQAADLLSASTIDRAALEKLRAEQLQAAEQLSRRVTQAIADVAEVLTPEQRVKAREMMQRRWGGRGPAAELDSAGVKG